MVQHEDERWSDKSERHRDRRSSGCPLAKHAADRVARIVTRERRLKFSKFHHENQVENALSNRCISGKWKSVAPRHFDCGDKDEISQQAAAPWSARCRRDTRSQCGSFGFVELERDESISQTRPMMSRDSKQHSWAGVVTRALS